MYSDKTTKKIIKFAEENCLKKTDYSLRPENGSYKVIRLNRKKCKCIFDDIQRYINSIFKAGQSENK